MEDKTVMVASLFAILLVGVIGVAGMMKVQTTASTIRTTSSVLQTPTCHCVVIHKDRTGRVLQIIEQDFKAGSRSADDHYCDTFGQRKFSGSRKEVECYRKDNTIFPR